MKTYTIKKDNFLEWYFYSGSDDEQEYTLNSFAINTINDLMKKDNIYINVSDIFIEANKDLIPLCLIEEFKELYEYDDEECLEDLNNTYNLQLLN
jgi:hypothetical protein